MHQRERRPVALRALDLGAQPLVEGRWFARPVSGSVGPAREPLAGLGVGDRHADELGEALEPLLGVTRPKAPASYEATTSIPQSSLPARIGAARRNGNGPSGSTTIRTERPWIGASRPGRPGAR